MASAGAKRYARAVFELAKEQGQVEAWGQRLHAVRDVLTQPERGGSSPTRAIAVPRRQQAALAILDESADAETGTWPGCWSAPAASTTWRDHRGVPAAGRPGRRARRALATTAVPLRPPTPTSWRRACRERLDRQVRLDTRVEPAIIGGLVLRIGDQVIDASVATRLQQLRRRWRACSRREAGLKDKEQRTSWPSASNEIKRG